MCVKDWEKQEAKRYDDLYTNGYPSGAPGAPILWAGLNNKRLSVLDLGCGLGVIANKYVHYTGIDISQKVINKNKGKHGEYYLIPISEAYMLGQFDLVLALDTLEHIPEKHIDDTLEAIEKIEAKQYLFSICCRASRIKDKDGNQLHQTIKSRYWWIKELWKHFVVLRASEYNKQRTFYVLLEPYASTFDR